MIRSVEYVYSTLRRSTNKRMGIQKDATQWRPAASKFGRPDGFSKWSSDSCICTHTAHPHAHPHTNPHQRSRIHLLTARYTMRSVLSRLLPPPPILCLPVHRPESPDNDSDNEADAASCLRLLSDQDTANLEHLAGGGGVRTGRVKSQRCHTLGAGAHGSLA